MPSKYVPCRYVAIHTPGLEPGVRYYRQALLYGEPFTESPRWGSPVEVSEVTYFSAMALGYITVRQQAWDQKLAGLFQASVEVAD
jgi:hypothetical protein